MVVRELCWLQEGINLLIVGTGELKKSQEGRDYLNSNLRLMRRILATNTKALGNYKNLIADETLLGVTKLEVGIS